MASLLYVTDSTFDAQVCKPDIPVLVHFCASWSASSRKAEPMLEEIARQYRGHLKIVQVDVDQNNMTSSQYRVHRAPTFILFLNGQEAERWSGDASKEEIIARITPYMRLDAVP